MCKYGQWKQGPFTELQEKNIWGQMYGRIRCNGKIYWG